MQAPQVYFKKLNISFSVVDKFLKLNLKCKSNSNIKFILQNIYL